MSRLGCPPPSSSVVQVNLDLIPGKPHSSWHNEHLINFPFASIDKSRPTELQGFSFWRKKLIHMKLLDLTWHDKSFIFLIFYFLIPIIKRKPRSRRWGRDDGELGRQMIPDWIPKGRGRRARPINPPSWTEQNKKIPDTRGGSLEGDLQPCLHPFPVPHVYFSQRTTKSPLVRSLAHLPIVVVSAWVPILSSFFST